MVKLSELEVGKTLGYVYGPVSRIGIKKYASASGDNNGIHINDDFAVQMRLKGVIAHGLYSFGMVARALGEIGEVVKMSTETYSLSYAKAEDAQKTLMPFVTKHGSIETDKRTNLLVVTDIPANKERIEKLIEQIDHHVPVLHLSFLRGIAR